MTSKPLSVMLGLALLTSPVMPHQAEDGARNLWAKMLAAKGINQVHVRTFLISSTSIGGSARFNQNAGRERSTFVGSASGAWWVFDDYRPGKLGYSVRVYNPQSQEEWIAFSGLTATWREQTLVYFLDSVTHLPKKLEIRRTVNATVPPHNGAPAKPVSKLVATPVEMEDYHSVSVDGLQVPGKVKLWDSWGRGSFRAERGCACRSLQDASRQCDQRR